MRTFLALIFLLLASTCSAEWRCRAYGYIWKWNGTTYDFVDYWDEEYVDTFHATWVDANNAALAYENNPNGGWAYWSYKNGQVLVFGCELEEKSGENTTGEEYVDQVLDLLDEFEDEGNFYGPIWDAFRELFPSGTDFEELEEAIEDYINDPTDFGWVWIWVKFYALFPEIDWVGPIGGIVTLPWAPHQPE